MNVKLVKEHLKVAFVTTSKLVEQFEGLGVLKETTGGQRNRRFSYAPYLGLFARRSLDPVQPFPSRERRTPHDSRILSHPLLTSTPIVCKVELNKRRRLYATIEYARAKKNKRLSPGGDAEVAR